MYNKHLYVVARSDPKRRVEELAYSVNEEGAKIAAVAYTSGNRNPYVPNPRRKKGTSWLGFDGSIICIVLDTRTDHGVPRVPFTYEEFMKMSMPVEPETYSNSFGPMVIQPEIA